MPFRRFVETGRVVLIKDGPYQNKLATVVDVIDQTRVLIDGPNTGVPRTQIRLSQVHLTKFRLRFAFHAPTRVVRKAWADSNVDEKWATSTWAQKLAAKEKRSQLGDFDRFKLRKARQLRNKIRTRVFHNLKAISARNGTMFGKKAKGGSKPKPKKSPKKEGKEKKPAKKTPTPKKAETAAS